MSDSPACPMKFPIAAGGLNIVDNLNWGCQGEICAWWSKGKECCAIKAIAMAQWAVVDAIRDSIPKDSQ